MYPDDGITKGNVLAYYEKVAGRLLPFLRDRPATLERLPDGLNGPRFWQKNLPARPPDGCRASSCRTSRRNRSAMRW